jgi:hypothetical protein
MSEALIRFSSLTPPRGGGTPHHTPTAEVLGAIESERAGGRRGFDSGRARGNSWANRAEAAGESRRGGDRRGSGTVQRETRGFDGWGSTRRGSGWKGRVDADVAAWEGAAESNPRVATLAGVRGVGGAAE